MERRLTRRVDGWYEWNDCGVRQTKSWSRRLVVSRHVELGGMRGLRRLRRARRPLPGHDPRSGRFLFGVEQAVPRRPSLCRATSHHRVTDIFYFLKFQNHHRDFNVLILLLFRASNIKKIQIIQEGALTPNEKQHSTVEFTKSAKKSQKNVPTETFQPADPKTNGTQTSVINNQFLSKFQNHGIQFNQKHNVGHANSYAGSVQTMGNCKSKPIDIQGRSNKMNGGIYLV